MIKSFWTKILLSTEELNFEQHSLSLDVSKMKAFADDKIKVAKIRISLFDRVENTGNRRKCW